MLDSEECQFIASVGARWSSGGSYPLYRFEVYPDRIHIYLQSSIFGNKPSCTIYRENILEIKRMKTFWFRALKIVHNDFKYPTFVAAYFGKLKDITKAEAVLNDLQYPIDLNSERKRIKISSMLNEITTYGDGTPKSG